MCGLTALLVPGTAEEAKSRGCLAIADVLWVIYSLPCCWFICCKSSRRKESREVAHGQRTKLYPHVWYTYLYTSHFLNHIMSFFFSFLKWSSSMGYKEMKSSSGMRKAGWLLPLSPLLHLTWLGINWNNDKISNLKGMLFLFYIFSNVAEDDEFFLFDGISLLCGISHFVCVFIVCINWFFS